MADWETDCHTDGLRLFEVEGRKFQGHPRHKALPFIPFAILKDTLEIIFQ